jgi:hypothetical protein
MYFPYLRGKQFELIALREIFQFLEPENLLSPIIEPVKETTVTLEKTINVLVEKNQNFNLIFNPTVGDMANPMGKDEIKKIHSSLLHDFQNYQPTFIVDDKIRIRNIVDTVTSLGLQNLGIICNSIPQNEIDFFSFIKENPIKYIIINENITSRGFLRQLGRLGLNKITLSDSFNVLRRNVDYLEKDDEFYSDEHIYFKEDGFVGFADFLTIGQEYSDTGFLPIAVAIHLTYSKDDAFWIRHFVSDSNEDKTDVAGKFAEALKKLVTFIDKNSIRTYASNEFRKLFKNETYPGLGSIKKLSILHHIELVNNYLNNHR